ncbi:hypothetical protein PTKIN_Ptkin03bG0062400 [Pterospermum kingtungense]
MRLMSWNARGLGQPLAKKFIAEMTQKYNPNICFVMETRYDYKKGEILARNWGYSNSTGMSSRGFSGGLLLIWDDNVSMNISSMNENLIFAYVKDFKNAFWLTCIYGNPKTHKRHLVWHQLKTFSNSLKEQDEWIVMGDFNQVLEDKDKLSFKNTTLRGADLLRNCIDHCQLSEIPPLGQYYTWSNKKEEIEAVWERLDRGFANPLWLTNHDKAVLYNFPVKDSDHGALLISTEEMPPFIRRIYRFEAMWLTDKDCEKVVEASWKNNYTGSPSFILVQKLKETKVALKIWNKNFFGNIFVRKKKLQTQLQQIQRSLQTLYDIKKEREIRRELQTIEEQEQIHWMQKSRVNWIVQGDRNTKFYHAVTKRRKIRNRIYGVYSQGRWLAEQKEMKEAFENHLSKVFNQNQEPQVQEILNKLEHLNIPKLDEEQANWLSQPFFRKEIETTAF